MTEDWREAGFALYVHWPFCQAKCPYCDFNSHVTAQIDQGRWAKALASEIKRYADMTQGRVLNSIFFGGGTPSLMQAETVETVLQAARDGWRWANDIEITLEANPTSVDATRFKDYAAAGVNRVSLGVQALRDADLKALGRLHSADEARTAFDVARSAFDRVSFDLIYGRQGQTLDDWQLELREALSMAVDHVSLYQLTIEPGTAFWSRHQTGGLRGLPDEDLAADLYEVTQELTEAAGFSAYEVSNHAKPGAQSKHNLIYWRYGDWIGVGPGAHGRLTRNGIRFATEAVSNPRQWLEGVDLGQNEETSLLPQQDIVAEHIMMGMRLAEGINLERLGQFALRSGTQVALADLEAQKLIWRNGSFIGATDHGRLLLNAVIGAMLPDERA